MHGRGSRNNSRGYRISPNSEIQPSLLPLSGSNNEESTRGINQNSNGYRIEDQHRNRSNGHLNIEKGPRNVNPSVFKHYSSKESGVNRREIRESGDGQGVGRGVPQRPIHRGNRDDRDSKYRDVKDSKDHRDDRTSRDSRGIRDSGNRPSRDGKQGSGSGHFTNNSVPPSTSGHRSHKLSHHSHHKGPIGSGSGGGSGDNGEDREEVVRLVMETLAGQPCLAPLSEWSLHDTRLAIGRSDDNDIQLLTDPETSRRHCVVSDLHVRDSGSFNGTFVNGMRLERDRRVRLKAGDSLKVGLTEFSVRAGAVNEDVFSRTKLFPGLNTQQITEKVNEDKRLDKLTVDEMMVEEFDKVVGHDSIKRQLRNFYKKLQLDEIREANGRLKNKQNSYHMIFEGPPGTGKTSMANLVARLMVKMKLVASPKVVFVNNALDLLAGYSGQTSGKVDAKVAEAAGGVLFIDEAYSIVQDGSQQGFGREAIDTIMKHLDPPTAVFIFAGYSQPMERFLRMNEGLGRRIPFRFTFSPYSIPELLKITQVMCDSKGERLADDVLRSDALPALLETIVPEIRETHNAGLVSNLLAFAQIERDCRIDIDAAELDPLIACTLHACDFLAANLKLQRMFSNKEPNTRRQVDNK